MKISEKKALEAYPVKELKDNFGTRDINRCMREAYIQGYEQAMQDFLEKAEMYLRYRVYYNTHPNNINVAINYFKNYMQNESEEQ